MLFERKDIEELKGDIEKASESLITFLDTRIKLSTPDVVEHSHPLMEINKNELNRLTSNLKTPVDLLLKLKPAKKGF